MRAFLSLLTLLLCVSARAADPLEMAANPCFENRSPGGVYPLVVVVKNRGPAVDARVVVNPNTWSVGGRRYVYPVNLPTGTIKRIIAYPVVEQYGGAVEVSLESRAGMLRTNVPLTYRGESQGEVGMVGDDVGALGVLRRQDKPDGRRRTPFNDSYCLPENAPERAAGYDGLSRLVIGEGAEKMNRAQWKAIYQWVLGGGSVILLGGANASYLRVPDAAPLVPLTQLRGASAPLSSLDLPVSVAIDATVAVTTGAPRPDTDIEARHGATILLSRRAIGAGTALLVGFNPLEEPVRSSANAADLWPELIASARPMLAPQQVTQIVYGRQAALSGFNPPYGQRPSGFGNNVAFELQLPPVGYVVWVFLAYFVLAVPVTYFVLRRLGRLELAWLTSPVLAAGFAFVFYLFTSDLYLAGMARRSGGVLVMEANSSTARFKGFTELFFPRGGSYAVEPPAAETLEQGEIQDDAYAYRGGGSRSDKPLTTIDLSTVSAPALAATNLSFHRILYQAPVTNVGQITGTLRTRNGRLTGSLRNGMGQTLRNVVIFGPNGRKIALGDLAPGTTSRVEARYNHYSSSWLDSILPQGRSGSAMEGTVLTAEMSGQMFGPALGRDYSGDRSVALLVSLPVVQETP